MKIAIVGSRGIPNAYGGFETCAEELALRLVSRGHDVTVYGCKRYVDPNRTDYYGVKLHVINPPRNKALEKICLSFFSLLKAAFSDYEVILQLGLSGAPFSFIPRLFGKKVVINVDGLEWRRKKWGKLAATVLKFSSRVAPILSNEVITDSLSVQKYYKEAYNAETTYIPYGRRQQEPQSFDILEELGVEPRGFFLYVSRFDPENNPLLVRKAYELVSSEKKLLMVGSAPYADDYIKQVKDTTDSRIVFTGAIYGDGYLQLQHSAYAYVQATEIGGVHPALVEAAGAGNCVIANDVPEHREVLLDAGIYYPGTVEGLAAKLQWAQDNPEPVAHHRSLSRKVAERFSWDSITTEYEVCFAGMLGVDNDALLAETMRNNEPASVSERVA